MSSTSVVRSSGLLRSPKSIMRRASRPTPLPLSPSPFPFSTSFNILFSAARSSHVHFPPSPALFATFATHSPNSYDRGPFPVSPSSQLNALSLTSPSLSGFKLSDPPKRTKKVSTVLQPQDPRSPRPAVMQSFAAAMSIGSKPRTGLNKALTTYPRSPYPSAPLSPDAKMVTQQAKAQEPVDGKSRVRASSAPSIARRKRGESVTRPTQDVKEKEPQNITFQMTSSRRLAPPHLDLSAASFMTPVQENTGAPPVHEASNPKAVNQSEDDLSALSDASSGEMNRLSNAFWQSVSIEIEEGSDQNNGLIEFGGFPGSGGASSDGGFPESVTGSQVSDSEDAVLRGLMSPRPGMIMPRIRVPPTQERLPTLTFGTSDGSVWSPGANEPSFSSISDEHDRLLAVADTLAVPRSVFTAPTPNDPYARFPSFVAALEAGNAGSTTTSKGMGLGSYLNTSIQDSVKLPPRVHMP